MDSILDSLTGAIVSKSLDMALLRHQVIANNIANVNTGGFRPSKVSFEQHLQSIGHQLEIGNLKDITDLRQKLSRLENHDVIEETGQPKVILDQEIVELTKNTINYQALLSANQQFGSLLKLAIKGGRQ